MASRRGTAHCLAQLWSDADVAPSSGVAIQVRPLNEQEARRLLLIRAVESEDLQESLLTREDRRHATDAALIQAPLTLVYKSGSRADRREGDAFLARRSAFAYARLAPRYPAVEQVMRRSQWPQWAGWTVPLAALILGIATNEIDSGKRLNIIAFPLIGMIAWNLGVYLAILVSLLRRGAARGRTRKIVRPNLLARILAKVSGPGRHLDAAQPSLSRALHRFAEDWVGHGSPLTYARASRTLHLAAASLAAGVISGMYFRALGVEYQAGWESTFIGTSALHRLLELTLGPASIVSGIPLPDQPHLQALRWSAGGGENAAAWIHLFSTTAFLFIIGPRLLLAAWHSARVIHLRRHFPTPGVGDFYVRRLLRAGRGGGSLVRVVPYSYHLSDKAQRQLQRAILELLGDQARVSFDSPIPYGEEDEWLATMEQDLITADHLIMLFNLSATPERENHGIVAERVKGRLQSAGAAAPIMLVDAAAYRIRLAGQSSADARIKGRLQAWTAVLADTGIPPLMLDLEAETIPDLARALETGLMQASSSPGNPR